MRRILVSIVFTVLLILWIGGYVYFVLMTGLSQPSLRSEKTDGIVVLTGGNYRIQTGLKLLSSRSAKELLISGVNPAVTKSTIKNIWKVDDALLSCCVSLDYKADTTFENARETKGWMSQNGFHSVRVVTSTYHMQRALMEFKAMMPEMIIIPHPVEEEDLSGHEAKFWVVTFYEYNKYIIRSAFITLYMGGIQ